MVKVRTFLLLDNQVFQSIIKDSQIKNACLLILFPKLLPISYFRNIIVIWDSIWSYKQPFRISYLFLWKK